MQIYLKVAGAWQSGPVDLSNFMWSMVCRDDPAGNVDEAIPMYGNAEISPSTPNYTELASRGIRPGVFVSNVGCRNWTGSLRMTDPLTTGQEVLTISNLVLENAIPTAAPTPTPGGGSSPYPLAAGEEISPGFGFVYAIHSGTATWTYDDQSGDCTYTGRWSDPLADPARPTTMFSNFTPPGAAARGLSIPGLLAWKQGQQSYD
ncbi:MAG TPA: hypothetical protein VFH61_14790 [Thermoleophilia bacterium]|nr:hypothetical protein [Thermoleophilia bacterium]